MNQGRKEENDKEREKNALVNESIYYYYYFHNLNRAVVRSHALLCPTLPVKVVVPHPLPGMIGEGGTTFIPCGGSQTTSSLTSFRSLVCDREDVVPTVLRKEDWKGIEVRK